MDISIWLHQIVRAMRDKRGEMVRNAHIKAMLSRLCRLLQHGIKPIFVFDGGAPPIKKIALAERRNRRAQGSLTLEQLQRRLLEAQLKRELLGDSKPRRRRYDDDMYLLPDEGPSGAWGNEQGEEGAGEKRPDSSGTSKDMFGWSWLRPVFCCRRCTVASGLKKSLE